MLSVSIPLALGRGTRLPGQPLAVFEVADGIDPQEIIADAWTGTLPQSTALAQGVQFSEVVIALRSPSCVLTGGRSEIVVGSEAVADAKPSNATADEWRKALVGRMYFGPETERIRRSLRAAKLKTADDVDREGNAHRGLTHIAGISDGDERIIAQTMRGLIESAGRTFGQPA